MNSCCKKYKETLETSRIGGSTGLELKAGERPGDVFEAYSVPNGFAAALKFEIIRIFRVQRVLNESRVYMGYAMFEDIPSTSRSGILDFLIKTSAHKCTAGHRSSTDHILGTKIGIADLRTWVVVLRQKPFFFLEKISFFSLCILECVLFLI